MNYTISEKRALKKLGIPDFRHMTKDKLIQFTSMIPHMNPEVAKAAIEQFPEFKDMGIQMVKTMQETVEKAFSEAKDSQKVFYNTCNKIIDTLSEELKAENINSEDRARIEDNMIQVAQMIGAKDTEFKHFLVAGIKYLAIGAATVATAAVALLGGNINFNRGIADGSESLSDSSGDSEA